MENANWIDCAKAKKMDLPAYLSSLGFEPVRIKNGSAWYRSPLREEHTASFKVNLSRNQWYDFGEGKGGDLVEFGTRYFKCSVKDFLLRLNQGNTQAVKPAVVPAATEAQPLITIQAVKPLTHPALLGYLAKREIDSSLARQYCRQVQYTNGDRNYFAIGFANQSGGYELRNKYFKGGSTPKDLTHFDDGHKEVAVFEGFMDMLSYLMVKDRWKQPERDILVLNSLSFVDRALLILEQYERQALFLDNNNAGLKSTDMIKQALPSASSFNYLYRAVGDINEYIVAMEKMGFPMERSMSKGIR